MALAGGLAATAVIQAAVVVVSGSVALLGDTLHNAADALTAVPLATALVHADPQARDGHDPHALLASHR